ncbi:hypothetical protein ACFFF7_05640 [Novosphingobium aquiterrae]|uniref:DUF4235 domain-containing protein n=1 Tax=Novosphingobium aquiterrae TaxID=624388 RepID=A0ABV6PGE1_9SPHN
MVKAPRILARKTKAAAKEAGDTVADKAADISPNPMTNLVLADIVLRGGGQLLRHAVERSLLQTRYSKGKAKAIVKGRSIGQTVVGTVLARVATRSIPGALVIGGGLLAKTLFDRRRGKAAARAEGKAAVDKQAEKGGADTSDA